MMTNCLLQAGTFPIWLGIIFCAVALVSGVVLGYFVDKSKHEKANNSATKIIQNALNEAKTQKKEAVLEAKEEVQKIKAEVDEEIRTRRFEIQRQEDRLNQREDLISQKEALLDKKSESLDEAKQNLEVKNEEISELKKKLEERLDGIDKELEKVAQMSREEAKATLIKNYEEAAKIDAIKLVREIEEEAKENAYKKAREIVTLAIQRCATDHTSEMTVSSITLPNEEMKGRIIGREGRNIRALEAATGADFIVDDTPETIVVSCFDPIRREIARQTLEKLMLDGRIHPTKIEEMVEKVTRDVEQTIKQAGENASFDADVHGLHPELIKILGRLKFRTSYGQNVLQHSLEVCYLSGLLASELGADVNVAKRGGLLHDIGKALDHETEGTHVTIGVDVARKYRESEAVIHCIEAHHGNVEFNSIEAIIVQIADAISSSRPGARRESLENYIKRLTQLENIASSFEGVEKSYAIQAGREVRIIVKPDEVDDVKCEFMAKDIAKKIEEQMQYPGQIKVNVIRESRKVEYAK